MNTVIRLGNTVGGIDPLIYGQFIEQALTCITGGVCDIGSPLSDPDGIRLDVAEKAKVLAPTILRFPGGTVMCQYHWEDAVGPMHARIRRQNLIWGGETDPSFGTAEFVQYCRRIGAEPMICVNMASGTPQEAGNWVEYCNGTGHTHYADLRRSHGFAEPFNVKYWCIGNESYAEPDIGIHNDVNLYVRDAMEFIKFMKLTDRSIQTIVVGCEREDWNKPVLDALHSVTDYLSIHHYSGENGKGLYGPFEGEKGLLQTLKAVETLLSTYPEKVENFNPWYRFPPRQNKLAIALDEWNIWDFKQDETYGLLQTYNWRDALWVASVLCRILQDPAIRMANMAQMVNVLAPIVAEKGGSWYQTIAYPLLLLRQTMLGERVAVDLLSPLLDGGAAGQLDALCAAAARNQDGTLRIAMVNRDLHNSHTVSLAGEGMSRDAAVQLECLQGDDPRATNSLTNCCVHQTKEQCRAAEIALPAGSVVLATLRA